MESEHDASHAWHACLGEFSDVIRAELDRLVTQMADSLARDFYRVMLADADGAARFLDHAAVNTRLRATMSAWVRALFDCTAHDQEGIEHLRQRQRQVGEVHARIGVPIALVSRGARVLKRALVAALVAGDAPRERLAESVQYVNELLDLAVDEMNSSYATITSRLARSDEAYRLFFLNQDMRAERERQKSHLLEWAHEILVDSYWSDSTREVGAGTSGPPSPFVMWLHHKASILFDGAPEVELIGQCIDRIEVDLAPRLVQSRNDPVQAREVVARINEGISDIKNHLGVMFDRFTADEDGRDSVTRLLNRRYFPTVARREVAIALRAGSVFALLLLAIDGYASLQRTIDSSRCEKLLANVAERLLDSVRAGDFVFRVGEDRFVVLVTELGRDALPGVAEGLSRQIGELRIETDDHAWTTPTVSIGGVAFDGHPDYQNMLDRAGEALEQAIREGGNRCVIGP